MNRLSSNFSLLFCFDFAFKGFSFTAACVLLVAIIIAIPDQSSQRRIPRQITGGHGCVKYKRWQAGGVVTICNVVSFQCLCNVPVHGFPKCEPVYQMRKYNVINGNRSIAVTRRVTIDCRCANGCGTDANEWVDNWYCLKDSCTNNVR